MSALSLGGNFHNCVTVKVKVVQCRLLKAHKQTGCLYMPQGKFKLSMEAFTDGMILQGVMFSLSAFSLPFISVCIVLVTTKSKGRTPQIN